MIWPVNFKKMRHLISVILICTLFTACEQQPKINYKNNTDSTSVMESRIKDTTKVLVAELPVKFDSTDVLIFAIRLVDLEGRGRYSRFESSSSSNSDIASSYFNKDILTGNLINLVFRDKNGEERKLTDRKILIKSVNFLREIFRQTNTGYLLYSIIDRDTNGDRLLNNSDLETLYISRNDGTGFKKISKELHEFYDFSIIYGDNKVYIRTLEDQNKDGLLNNQDKFHYYTIDFMSDTYKINEYNPLKTVE